MRSAQTTTDGEPVVHSSDHGARVLLCSRLRCQADRLLRDGRRQYLQAAKPTVLTVVRPTCGRV
eukprot:1982700-Prymnesium_polylepis.1